MSTKSLIAAERRRKPDDVRAEALAIGRRLLIEGGPAAITLKAIGAEMGMSHANLIHHFGSAEAFQNQLKTAMGEELTRRVTDLIRRQGGKDADVGEIVDTVFSAYASGGIGMLIAWSTLTKAKAQTEGLEQALGELVNVLEPLMEGPAAASRARAVVVLVSILALGDSLIGAPLAQCVGGDPGEMRRLTVRILEQLQKTASA
jgi:TetR/AcrR family transcriptional regulator, repressor for neighboring sulfatase